MPFYPLPPRCHVKSEKGQICELDLGHDGYHENGSIIFDDKGIIVEKIDA